MSLGRLHVNVRNVAVVVAVVAVVAVVIIINIVFTGVVGEGVGLWSLA